MTPQILREYLIVVVEFGWQIGVGLIVLACVFVMLRDSK
jgi:hypothetical protein